jgi:hypothetical protein
MTLFDDPQALIDSETPFFLYGRGRRHQVILLDGIAAGSPWYLFKFLDGDLAGKDLWLEGDFGYDEPFQYMAEGISDGFLFNPDRATGKVHQPNRYGTTIEALDETEGGTYLPELSGTFFYAEER